MRAIDSSRGKIRSSLRCLGAHLRHTSQWSGRLLGNRQKSRRRGRFSVGPRPGTAAGGFIHPDSGRSLAYMRSGCNGRGCMLGSRKASRGLRASEKELRSVNAPRGYFHPGRCKLALQLRHHRKRNDILLGQLPVRLSRGAVYKTLNGHGSRLWCRRRPCRFLLGHRRTRYGHGLLWPKHSTQGLPPESRQAKSVTP